MITRLERPYLSFTAALAILLFTGTGCRTRTTPEPNTPAAPPRAAESTVPLRAAGIFSDNMVLQQGVAVPIWGWADEGLTVTVTFRDQKVTGRVRGGKWMVKLKSLGSGGPDTLTIAAGSTLSMTNVMVGEVWVCSGQSNMEWPLSRSYKPEEDIATATNPNIRLYTVPKLKSDAPVSDIKASWQQCRPASVPDFSAVAWYFGRDLQKARNVPVGLIHTSWGGSPAEGWMSQAALEANPRYRVGSPGTELEFAL